MSLRKLAALSVIGVTLLVALVALPATKALAAAQCYGYEANSGGFTPFSCEDAKRQYPDFAPTDGCYKSEFMGSGGVVGFTRPQSVPCDQVDGKTYAQCYIIREHTVGEEKIKVTKKEPCTPDAKTRILANEKVMNANTCYIVDMTSPTGAAGDIDCATAAAQEWNSVANLQKAQAEGEQDAETKAAQDKLAQDQNRVVCSDAKSCTDPANNHLFGYIITAVNFLSGAVAIVVVIVIILAGIQYTTSGGDPGKTAQAKGRIVSAVIALLAYFTMFMFMQWLVPGGFLN